MMRQSCATLFAVKLRAVGACLAGGVVLATLDGSSMKAALHAVLQERKHDSSRKDRVAGSSKSKKSKTKSKKQTKESKSKGKRHRGSD